MTLNLEPFLREYRTHRMARFAFCVVAYGVALWLMGRFSRGVPGLLWFLFWVSFLPSIVYYLVRLVRFVRHRLLWQLRRRLILTYFFIAVVPVGLIVLLVGLGVLLVGGQFASFLVVSNLHGRVDDLQELGRIVSHHAKHSRQTAPRELLNELQGFVGAHLEGQSANYPALEVTLRIGSAAKAFRLDGQAVAEPATISPWLNHEEFSGTVLDRGQVELRAVSREQTKLGELTVILSQPFTPELLDLVGSGIGPVGVFSTRRAAAEASGQTSQSRSSRPSGSHGDALRTSEGVPEINIRSKSVEVPAPTSYFDYTVRNIAALDPIRWEGQQQTRDTEMGLFLVTSRIAALNRQLLSTLGQLSGLYWFAFAVVGIVFLVIELVALVIGIQLTRSITTTVDKLNEATEHVKAGDFSYRIALPARDQLTALGEAFDGMTASVERLVRESLEKTRLEGELEIAREVQTRLFPQTVPEVKGLRVHGVCKPARVVSGDYYDFLRLSEDRMGLVLGDISGKGISAALLMAAIQSALHAQFYNGYSLGGLSQAAPLSTADVVARLNRQLVANTPKEKYVTFFYAVYDGATGRMAYTNAGHLPPVLFRRGRIERLETGGTVVGLFPAVRYEQAEVQLEPGDLLLAYTDGITEPENSFGEEFGEGRLLDVVQRALGSSPEVLVDEIYHSVSDWTGSPELQDDMTLVVAKAVSQAQ